MRSALLVAVFALLAVPARAQSNDPRWEPWLGCWTLATENLRSAEQEGPPQRATRPSTVVDGAPRVCVTQATNGARFETTVGTQSAIDQTIVADAVAHPVNDAECAGTQRAEWSKNGLRLFSSADIRCQGDDGQRRVSGLSLIAPNGDWLDIQTVSIGSRESIRVKRYYRTADSPRSGRPSVAASGLTLDEVKEASRKVSSAALEAALVETGAGFNLSKKSVIDLDAAGVPDRIIDLIVALSYPDKFVIQRVGQASAAPPYVRDPFFGGPFGYPYSYDPFYGSSYYYGSPYYYEPFGYRGVVLIEGTGGFVGSSGGGTVGAAPNGPGRAINGQGYTRIVPRDSLPSVPSTTARTSSTSSSSSGDSSSSSGSSSSGSSGGSSGGSTASPGGYSNGGSGDSGRTAVPR